MKDKVAKLLIVICVPGFLLVGVCMLLRAPGWQKVTPASTKTESEPAQYGTRDISGAREPSRASQFNKVEPDSERDSTAEPVPAEPPEGPDECRQWAREHPEQALAWLAGAASDPRRHIVAEMVCVKVAESNPAEAVALAEKYAPDDTYLLENLVFQWADRDEWAARTYALARPIGEERDRMLARVALKLAQQDPVEAARLVSQEVTPGDIQNEAAMSVVHQWALRNPDQALAWVQLFPEGDLRNRALTEVENIIRFSRQQQPAETGK
jgi:hypothetical protein